MMEFVVLRMDCTTGGRDFVCGGAQKQEGFSQGPRFPCDIVASSLLLAMLAV
jgi:hypothetical protein